MDNNQTDSTNSFEDSYGSKANEILRRQLIVLLCK